MQQPQRAEHAAAEAGLSIDIPTMRLWMVRRSAYALVGGYRNEFYYADWDLSGYGLPTSSFFRSLKCDTWCVCFPVGSLASYGVSSGQCCPLPERAYAPPRDHDLKPSAASRPRPASPRKRTKLAFATAGGLSIDTKAEGAYFIANRAAPQR